MKSRPRLTYENVMVTLLAFVVLFGGGAYAAGKLGKNSVGTKQLRKNAVTSAKVKNRTLLAKDFADGVLPQPEVPSDPEVPPRTTSGFQALGSVNYDKFSSRLFGSTVVTRPVPPGAYFATSTVSVQTVNPVATNVTCRLTNGPSATTRTQVVRADTEPENFTLTALFEVAAGQDLELQCHKLDPASSARVLTANIVAVQVHDVAGFSD